MSANKKNKFKHVVYDLSRINEWWLLSLGMVLFAFVPYKYVLSDRIINYALFTSLLTEPSLYIALIVVFSAQIFLFASNDYFDRHVDALDTHKKKRNPVCSGAVTLPGVRVLLIVSGILPLIASTYFGMWAFVYTAFAMFVFYFYTAPPLRFKNKVGLDVLSHGIFVNTFPYFFCLVALNDFTVGTTFLLTVVMMRSTMAQLFQEIRDYEVDKQVERNTVVILGQRRSLWLVFSVYIGMFAVTVSLMTSYILWGWGIQMYYAIILLIWATYIPVFHKLMKAKNLGKSIEKLWMGQGRTNLWQAVQYVLAFALYALFMTFLWFIDYL
ncbi:MAG: UbiA family prenyltransferase [Candidatus Thermoplasmatota archaeon]|nr:UbiA family prenyltransferase [Candidatus Thermoplasmatota archaeon]MBU4144920.1 UbiA family prenyltransferase [Candidatus Thermoplasmatota archaeon]MBU4591675.1 UbiA family prenyltransferase [Candidatus Thermoplasmatota archaeon]